MCGVKNWASFLIRNIPFCVYICIYWKRRWHPTPVLLPGKSHGWRSLVGCSPWGCKELDMTERLPFHFWLSCIGEGNGNPLQCSCLENPWWAAIYGVTQHRTRLKRLSSSSSGDQYHMASQHSQNVCKSIYIILCEIDRQSRFNAWDRVLRAGALGWRWGMV